MYKYKYKADGLCERSPAGRASRAAFSEAIWAEPWVNKIQYFVPSLVAY